MFPDRIFIGHRKQCSKKRGLVARLKAAGVPDTHDKIMSSLHHWLMGIIRLISEYIISILYLQDARDQCLSNLLPSVWVWTEAAPNITGAPAEAGGGKPVGGGLWGISCGWTGTPTHTSSISSIRTSYPTAGGSEYCVNTVNIFKLISSLLYYSRIFIFRVSQCWQL